MLGLPKYIVDTVHTKLLYGASNEEIEEYVRRAVAYENEWRASSGIKVINLPERVAA